tara:strand:- start:1899 stop:2273 length:375 start_codon:yes stop_codon:yes gene_type:complete
MGNMSSNRSFGIIFSIVFFLIAVWPILNNQDIRYWSIVISLVFFILGLLNSTILTPLNKVWSKFGILLNKIIPPIIMFIIFFFIVTPTGFILKLFGKDLLKIKKKNVKTFWIKAINKTSMKDQF